MAPRPDSEPTPTPSSTDIWGGGTRWTWIAQAAGDEDPAQRDEAWRQLIERYRTPVTRCLRRKLGGRQAPEDLADEFFSYLFTHGVLHKPKRERGKFRKYIQRVIHYYALGLRRGRAEDRRKVSSEPGDFDVGLSEPADGEVEREDLKVWADSYLEHALGALQERSEYYHHLVNRAFGLDGGAALSRAELAQLVDRKKNAVNVSIKRLYDILEEELRREIRDTVSDPEALEDEWLLVRRYLLDAYPGLRDRD